MHTTRTRILFASLAASLVLAGCGGGNGTAEIGGTLTNLTSGMSITLQNNSGDNLSLTSNQSFVFPTALSAGSTYNVTVLTQPVGQTCAVANGTGTVDSYADDVSNIAVICTTTSSVGGVIAGLASGTSVTLSNNGQALAVATNGSFAFPGLLTAGTAYNVVVATQPAGQTCTVSSSSGTVVANTMASVSVVCN